MRPHPFTLTAILVLTATAVSAEDFQYEYAPAPAGNPLKGLVPYAGEHREEFPHSMEFNYLPLSVLVVGERTYDWQPLENLLDDVASRGHQTIFRIWMEYPGHNDGIPQYLVDQGLTIHEWNYTNTEPFPNQKIRTPDYDDPRLRTALVDFIAALGERYDGDRRIGFITAGLLGAWGEWHTYPRSELFAGRETQQAVLDTYEAAFETTRVLLRYPAGEGHWNYVENALGNFGYHDDSFAFATLETGREEDDWFYMSLLHAAGESAVNKWKSQPIGGEIRPELWGEIFDEDPGITEAQDFDECVAATHASWVMDTGMFRGEQPPARVARAIAAVQRMGYEFYIPSAKIEVAGNALRLTCNIENRGIAPFYYAWPAECGLAREGEILAQWQTELDITGLLPGEVLELRTSVNIDQLPAGTSQLMLRIANPLEGAPPVRFANTTQDADIVGWLTLGSVEIP